MANNKGIPDFAKIKEEVGFEEVLKHYGLLDGLKRKGEQLTGACPLHKGDGKSCFSVNLARGRNCFNCFSCRAHGNVLDFVAVKEEVILKEAGLLLSEWFNVPLVEGRIKRTGTQSKAEQTQNPPSPRLRRGELVREKEETEKPAEPVNPPLTFELKNLNPDHPYLKERGLTPETIHRFGLGFCKKGLMAGRVVIPIHNEKGGLIAYAGRAIDEQGEKDGRYKLPSRFQKSFVLFNLHRAKEHVKEKGLVLVEGYFSVFRLFQAGFPQAVALMGSTLSAIQEELIISTVGHGGKIVLLMDNDEAGRNCQKDVLERLVRRCFVKAPSLPAGVPQVDEMPEGAIKDLLL